MARNEDDGNRLRRANQLALQVEAAQARHADIEDQARRTVPVAPVEELLRGRETLYIQRNRADQTGQGLADRDIIIDDVNDGVRRLHSADVPLKGSRKRNVVPDASLGTAHIRPPCASIMVRLIARPMPKPRGLVV